MKSNNRTIKHSNNFKSMKHVLVFSLFAFPFSLASLAAPSYWAAAYAQAAKADKSGGTQLDNYSGYYCTVETAYDLFGGAKTIKAVTDYFVNNYDTAKEDIEFESALYGGGAAAAGVLGSSLKEYDHGQYAFNSTYGDTLAGLGSAYLAILLYETDAVKEVYVMSSDADELANGNAYFNDADPTTTGSHGSWATVPEPTSAMLFLLGLAGLALNRRRAQA